MESLGLTTPSTTNNCINFIISKNEPQVLEKMLVKPEILQIESNSSKILKHKIFLEKGAPFIHLKTSLCKRPLKLLIDTGASVSIIASNVINKSIHKISHFFTLFGIAGKEVSVTTEGMVHSIFNFNNTYLGSTFHLVDRKYLGNVDGYLGFDFLAPYKVAVDLESMCLRINLDNIMTHDSREDQLEEKEKSIPEVVQEISEEKEKIKENFLTILAQNYEFEPINSLKNLNKAKKRNKIVKEIERKKLECKEYYNAVKTFDKNKYEHKQYIPLSSVFEPKEKKKERQEYEDVIKTFKKRRREYEQNLLFSKTLSQNESRADVIFNELNLEDCSETEKDYIKDLCEKFPKQFYLKGDPIGTTHVFKHKIHLLPDAKIVNVKQYRIPHAHKKPMQEIIDKYERDGIIEKCQSPYNSPAFLVPKKDDAGGMND